MLTRKNIFHYTSMICGSFVMTLVDHGTTMNSISSWTLNTRYNNYIRTTQIYIMMILFYVTSLSITASHTAKTCDIDNINANTTVTKFKLYVFIDFKSTYPQVQISQMHCSLVTIFSGFLGPRGLVSSMISLLSMIVLSSRTVFRSMVSS